MKASLDFDRVWSDKLTADNLLALHNLVKKDYTGRRTEDILQDIALGYCQLWKGTGAQSDFVVVTEIRQHKHKRELYVLYLAGKGFIPHVEEVYANLLEYAKAEKCDLLTCRFIRKGFNKVYANLPKKEVATLLTVEIDNND